MWGIVPAAGAGSRIQPLAFSKELLPVGSRDDGGVERPRAVSEYLLDRLLLGGATRVCFVIAPTKTDILTYYGGYYAAPPGHTALCYAVQDAPRGLCDALFSALPFVAPEDEVLVGLPDTVWFPEDGFRHLPDGGLSFLLFPVERPELFDAVLTDDSGRVREIRVKQPDAGSPWIWGAFKLPGWQLAVLHDLWCRRGRADQYLGTLVNAYLADGGTARGVRAGAAYVDTGTLHGYREAVTLIARRTGGAPSPALLDSGG
jgi:dTDP-glucose pyrophosphorylase